MMERLGWTLVHFLWQGALITALYAATRRWASRPNARYLLACTALAAMVAAPFATFGITGSSELISSAPLTGSAAPATQGGTAIITSISWISAGSARASAMTWIVLLWLFGATTFCVRLMGAWWMAARMRSTQVRPAPAEWQHALAQLGARIGVTRPVRFLISALVQTPTVVGWLRPVVLVPIGALTGLPPEQVEALLAHELAHIRRHDYLVNILQSVAEALLFYHPAVWWVSGHIRQERELCCDDMAVSISCDVLTYARALAELESNRPAHSSAAIAANGGSLADRIARLLGQDRPAGGTGLGPGALAVTILLVAAAYELFGQSDAHPAFQAISIKRNTSDWNERFQHPMGLGVNSSLMLLIQFVYAAHDNPMQGHSLPLLASQVIGGPAWISSEGYDIEVKPGYESGPQRWWLMWQTLLADRFRLKLHRETRELPIYFLTASTNGLKLPAAARDVGCVSFPPGTQPHHVPGKVDCGYVSGPWDAGAARGNLQIDGSRIHTADLIRELASVLDRPVLDKTGFTGEFDLRLNFTPDEALRGFPIRLPTDPNLPNIFAALEEQLGLKLVPAKGPVEVLVIDHVERPAGN